MPYMREFSMYMRICTQPGAYLEGTRVFVATKLVHLCHLFLPFLESTEVVLDQERRVELADGYVIVS